MSFRDWNSRSCDQSVNFVLEFKLLLFQIIHSNIYTLSYSAVSVYQGGDSFFSFLGIVFLQQGN